MDAGTLNEWPENIVADRHEVSGSWVIWYLTDEQAAKCRDALKVPDDEPHHLFKRHFGPDGKPL